MEKITEARKFEISSDCSCEYYDDNEELQPSDECFGCFTDDKENFKYEILNPWLEANGWDEDTVVLVFSNNMNWNSVAGWTNIYASQAVDCLTLNGEFTLRYTLEGKQLTCVRSSHDEMGALFTFSEAQPDYRDGGEG